MNRKLRTLIASRLHVPVEKVTSDADLVVDLGADSLVLAELLGEIEQFAEKQLEIGELEDMRTVGDLESFMQA